ncbi:hypothetical protein [Paludifilum halophilum]|uniref:Uncharacterized protein n=1 Tax=Paludifilum halophilum TaxID=1642702 RepID=A0A235B5S9_9BACL|nr:hypothetical protein [Paludifilum halophilum]OYD07592.1 hypothetical protein CHM34_08890 [Paludifilum halophilum]
MFKKMQRMFWRMQGEKLILQSQVSPDLQAGKYHHRYRVTRIIPRKNTWEVWGKVDANSNIHTNN